MLHIKSFSFNPFQENTYLLYDDENTAFIFDPGNSNTTENETLKAFIKEKNLKLTRLLLTHAHIDHVLGNRFIFDTYGLKPEVHEADSIFIERMPQTAEMYGVPYEAAPVPDHFLKEGDVIQLGKYELVCLHTPGHSPGSISFYNKENNIVIGGDVLFYLSIGRSDLPLGDSDTLIKSIEEKLMTLPDDVRVYPGHGPSTTIGFERQNNPYL